MNPWWVLSIDDPDEMLAVVSIIKHAREVQDINDDNLAARIANAVAKSFKGKK